MKNQLRIQTAFIAVFLFATTLLSSCQAIGSIFRAGVWVGVIAVIVVIGLIIWAISSMFGGK